MSETGSVKFTCDQAGTETAPFAGFEQLNEFREKLFRLGLLGVDANGIGFGNISVRDGATNRFHITGSGTGSRAALELKDCAVVVAYDFAKNWLRCTGGTVASSESLTHAAIYEAEPAVGAVIHCHSLQLWNAMKDKVPTTSDTVAYGSPEMAYEVQRLFQNTEVGQRKLFVMGGHPEGIIAFGRDLPEAFDVLRAACAKVEIEPDQENRSGS